MELSEEERKLIEKFEAREPSLEEIKTREITEEQFSELCLRLKCRVKMNRWNPVQDYKKRLMREGRLQTKTPRNQLKLLAKAVNRHKEKALYSDEHIAYVRHELWVERMKDNLMLLDLWDYDRKVEAEKKRKERSHTYKSYGENNNMHEYTTVTIETQHITMEDTQNAVDDAEIKAQSCAESQAAPAAETESQYNQYLLQEFEMVNTDSFSVSQLGSETVGDEILISQPILTEEFDVHVPLTSTQKSQEPD